MSVLVQQGVFDALAAEPDVTNPVDAHVVAAFAARLAAYPPGHPLESLLGDFRDAGYARDVQSWLAPGASAAPTLPVEAVTRAIGDDHVISDAWIVDTCRSTGLDRIVLLTRLAALVPWAVKTLTPRGELPSPRGMQMGLDVLRRRAARP